MTMKKTIVFLTINLSLASIAFSQPFKGEVDSMNLPPIASSHYQPEYDIDVSVNPDVWTKEKQGMHAAFGSEDELYFRTEVPQIKNESASWEATGWKGERLNAQIVVWSPDTLEQVRFEVSDLKNE